MTQLVTVMDAPPAVEEVGRKNKSEPTDIGSDASGAETSGPRLARRIGIAGWILAVCLVVDQVTKLIAVRSLPIDPLSFLGDTFRLQLAYNTGAFLGLAGTWSPEVRFWLLTVLNGIFLVVLAGVLVRYWNMALGRFVACAGILAGGIGNMIDRVGNAGQVTDFMNIGLGPLRSGIFNVADMAITGGALLLAWYWVQEDRQARAADRTG